MDRDNPLEHAQQREAALAADAASWDTSVIATAAPGDIPVIDISGLLDARGRPTGGLSKDRTRELTAEIGAACREVGFYSLIGHPVSPALMGEVFEVASQFHALDADTKLRLAMDRPGLPQGVGYLPPMHRKLPRRAQGNNNEAFIVKRDRDLPLDNNQWPSDAALPGFRRVVESYANAMESLGRGLLPLYAASLQLPADFFSDAFTHPLYRLRLTHYPPPDRSNLEGASSARSKGFGIAPHVDTSFMTILAQDAPGLVVYSERRGGWVALPLIDGALVVNSGELLKQWTNDEFLSVKHFANNATATDSRYSVPFFLNANSNYPMACVPSCTGPDRPAKYPTVTYAESQGVVQGE